MRPADNQYCPDCGGIHYGTGPKCVYLDDDPQGHIAAHKLQRVPIEVIEDKFASACPPVQVAMVHEVFAAIKEDYKKQDVSIYALNEIMGGVSNVSGPYGLHREELKEILDMYEYVKAKKRNRPTVRGSGK